MLLSVQEIIFELQRFIIYPLPMRTIDNEFTVCRIIQGFFFNSYNALVYFFNKYLRVVFASPVLRIGMQSQCGTLRT